MVIKQTKEADNALQKTGLKKSNFLADFYKLAIQKFPLGWQAVNANSLLINQNKIAFTQQYQYTYISALNIRQYRNVILPAPVLTA